MAEIVSFFNNFLGGAVFAFLLMNVFNFIELGVLLKLTRDVHSMLDQLKAEGRKDKWLK